MSLRGRRHGGNAAQNALIFSTTCGPDDQFSSPKQIRWSAAGSPLEGKLLVAQNGVLTAAYLGVRLPDLSFYTKFYPIVTGLGYWTAVDSDQNSIFAAQSATPGKLTKLGFDYTIVSYLSLYSIRMIDASGDPDYVYVTSNNATDGHGVRKIRKSDMTVVASLLATGGGDGEFNNPLGVFYYDGYVYVCDSSNSRIVKLDASDLSFVENVLTSFGSPYDICTDGSYFYIAQSGRIYRYDMSFTDATKIISASANFYSITLIPDQGDGNGATLAITDSINSHIARYKCSDLTQVGSDVGSSGGGSASLFDPVITGPAGTWFMDDGQTFEVASAANISWNGFSGYTWKTAGPHRAVFRPAAGGLAAITGIDSNSDLLSGNMKNLYKCVNLTSLKLQTNPALVLNLGQLTSKLQTVWAYACGEGISGSIRHMRSATSINLRENGASQTQVDQWISDLYANKDIMAAGTANFNGNNAAPSAAGKAQADELINDYSWTIAYTP